MFREWYRVQGSGFRVRVQGSGFRVQGRGREVDLGESNELLHVDLSVAVAIHLHTIPHANDLVRLTRISKIRCRALSHQPPETWLAAECHFRHQPPEALSHQPPETACVGYGSFGYAFRKTLR